MLLIRGTAGGTALTGTLYEPGDEPPSYQGAPDEGAPYVWVCDSFYEVESGGQLQKVGDREVNVAFETPSPRGFEARDRAVDAAKRHIRTQFQRVGVDAAVVSIEIVDDPE